MKTSVIFATMAMIFAVSCADPVDCLPQGQPFRWSGVVTYSAGSPFLPNGASFVRSNGGDISSRQKWDDLSLEENMFAVTLENSPELQSILEDKSVTAGTDPVHIFGMWSGVAGEVPKGCIKPISGLRLIKIDSVVGMRTLP